MAKDALGHGSNGRGGALTPVQQENQPFKSSLGGKHYLDPKDPRGAHASGTAGTPQLQRRHFEAIAAELKNAPDAGSPEHAKRVSDTADKLSTTNPGFRRDYFVKASTPGGGYNNKTNKSSRADVQRKAKKFMGS